MKSEFLLDELGSKDLETLLKSLKRLLAQKAPDHQPELLPIAAAAGLLGVSKNHFRSLASRHDFGAVHLSARGTRWNRDKIIAYRDARTVQRRKAS